MTSDTIERRTLLKAAALLTAASGVAHAQAVLHSTGTERPRLVAPANATDCHMHIYDSRFPPAPNATLRPPDAHVEDYRALQKRLGLTRTIVVQPSTYGTDNRCTLDALAAFGATARAVAVVDTSVADAELKRLDGLGVRGIRFNLVQAGATTIDMLEPLSKRITDLGWHVQLHMRGEQIAEAGDLLLRLPSPIVFDHIAHIPLAEGTAHPSFRIVRSLLDKGRAWVKLSGAYQDTKLGPPGYDDVSAIARQFVKAAPERMVWASDWPHPTEKTSKPDDAVLFDLLVDWAPDETTRNGILVANPETLYGFPRSA